MSRKIRWTKKGLRGAEYQSILDHLERSGHVSEYKKKLGWDIFSGLDDTTAAKVVSAIEAMDQIDSQDRADIRGLIDITLNSLESRPQKTKTRPKVLAVAPVPDPVPDHGSDPERDRFEQFFKAEWPENPVGPERIGSVMAAWNKATQKIAATDIMRACRYYVECFYDPTKGMEFPMRCRNFLSDSDDFEILRTWIFKAGHTLTSTENRLFEAAYSRYPNFSGKDANKKGAIQLWKRFVKPERRLDFYFSCVTYAGSRKNEPDTYTLAWRTFVARWEEPSQIRMSAEYAGRHLAGPLKKAMADYGFESKSQSHATADAIRAAMTIPEYGCLGYSLEGVMTLLTHWIQYGHGGLLPNTDVKAVFGRFVEYGSIDGIPLSCYSEGIDF